jgi:hypothetical protein
MVAEKKTRKDKTKEVKMTKMSNMLKTKMSDSKLA